MCETNTGWWCQQITYFHNKIQNANALWKTVIDSVLGYTHIDILAAWVISRLSTIQKVISYHKSPKQITSLTHIFWVSDLNCVIQNVYQDLKQPTDAPGGSRTVWELSRVGRCVAHFPPLLSTSFKFPWEQVALGRSGIIWAQASILTDVRTYCRGGSNLYADALTNYSAQARGSDAFLLDFFSWKSCGLTNTVIPLWRPERKLSLSPQSCDLLETRLSSVPGACLVGSC